jgi:glyoxylase-like metal-dependent hydrolase (beta-lactamase superfamily II)
MKVYHLNCVQIESPLGSAIGHCVLIEKNGKLTLIDAGIGMTETKDPEKTLGKDLIEITGFKFDEKLTAIRQIQRMGFDPINVTNIICSHLDPDHIGGFSDFPKAIVHVSQEEYESFSSGNERYLSHQLSYKPELILYSQNNTEWFGLSARKLNLNYEAYLIPLFGHTLGHCGVVFRTKSTWTFYVGDAYYLKAELNDRDHPVDQLASIRAMDNEKRKESLEKVRNVVSKYSNEIEYFGYHDPTEFRTE